MATQGEIGQFRMQLAAGLGWTFADSDVPHLARELDSRAQKYGHGHNIYLARLAAGRWPEEMSAIAERLAITETYFFRHGDQIRALAEVALPDRVAAGGACGVLRMLSVGCSSGEEAYTLAIVARDALPDPGWAVSVLGLDANPVMIGKARAARYSAWSLRETPDAVRVNCFHLADDGGYQVKSRIRDLVTFQEQNVTQDAPELWRAGRYDVIFCRNLLMYLTRAAAADLIQRMTLALAPGGYLFLGHTDSLGSRPHGLEPQASHSTFYYRRPTDRVHTPAPDRLAVPVVVPQSPRPTPQLVPPPTDAHTGILALMQEERFTEALRESAQLRRVRPADRLLHGVLLAQAGRLDEAEILVRELVDADGLNADAHHLLGVCLEGEGSMDGALGQYRLAAYLDPAFGIPRLRLGLLARRRGEDRNAAAKLERALHLLPDEHPERIVQFGGGFGRAALIAICRSALDACGVRR